MRSVGAAGDPAQSSFRAPSPLKAARPFLVLSLLPLLAGATGLIPERDGLVLGVLIAGTAALRAGLEHRQLSRLRRHANRQLLGIVGPRSPELVAWRTAELTSDHNRRQLGKALRGVVSDLDPRRLPGASPLNRPRVRPHADLILQLADRVEDAERPISARGVLLVEELLTDGYGPLYEGERAEELGPLLARCLRILDEGQGRGGTSSVPAGDHVKLHVARNGRR